MASRKILRLGYEVLTFHTSFCTEKCVPYSTLGGGGRHHRSDAAGRHTHYNVRSSTDGTGAAGRAWLHSRAKSRHVGFGALAQCRRPAWPHVHALWRAITRARRASSPAVSASAFAGMPLPRMPLLPACSAANLVPCAPISCAGIARHVERGKDKLTAAHVRAGLRRANWNSPARARSVPAASV